MSLPGISVLLPCRDAEAVLGECIRSLREQTFEDFEVLAVDDGSRDGTREHLDRWAAEDRRVHVIEGAGRGLVAALNVAASRGCASLLARRDADDVALPERFERQWSFLRERSDVAACGTGVRYFPRERVGSGYARYEGWINSIREPEELERDLLVECPIAHPTLVVRARAFREAGGYRDRGWPEDYDLLLRLHRAGRRLANVPGALLRWRITPGRLSMRSEAYSPAAFRRCKVHHLCRGYLQPGRPVVVWGAGRVGKPLARTLVRHQVQPSAFVDLDPRKIGQEIHGAIVHSPSFLERAAEVRPFVIVAVGSPGAREEIRAWLDGLGFEEPADYRALA